MRTKSFLFAVVLALLAVQFVSALAPADTKCVSIPIKCRPGYEPYISHYDKDGCPVQDCRPSSNPQNLLDVSVIIYASPQVVAPDSPVFVESRISISSDSIMKGGQMQFKIVSSISEETSFSGPKENSFLLANEGLIEKVVSQTFRKVWPTEGALEEKIPQKSITSIAPVPSSGQERVDYVLLRPGESTAILAYFNSGNPGNKFIEVKVYAIEEKCPKVFAEPSLCSTTEYLVGYSCVAIKVTTESSLPPSPPTDFEQEAVATLKLRKGWNMVSLPVDTRLPISNLVSACGAQPHAWRFAQPQYEKEDYLLPGVGYWVKATKDCTINISANQYVTSIKPLSKGWNLIGSTGSPVKIWDYSGNCKILSGPWHYDSKLAGSPNPYTYSASLEPGKAYWIKVESSCQMGLKEGPLPQPLEKTIPITSVSGPSQLRVGEQGAWSISAYNPESKRLTYSFLWGDGSQELTIPQSTLQTVTATHAYSKPGKYTVVIIITDEQGASVQQSVPVQVLPTPLLPITCHTVVECISGYSPVFSHFGEDGCPVFTCEPQTTR